MSDGQGEEDNTAIYTTSSFPLHPLSVAFKIKALAWELMKSCQQKKWTLDPALL